MHGALGWDLVGQENVFEYDDLDKVETDNVQERGDAEGTTVVATKCALSHGARHNQGCLG